MAAAAASMASETRSSAAGPECNNEDAWLSVEVPRGASANKVAVISRELRPEWRRSHGTAVELQEESVFTLPQTRDPIPVWSQTAMGASGRVALLAAGLREAGTDTFGRAIW